jgi:chloramphenicol-sensitive protein RarD
MELPSFQTTKTFFATPIGLAIICYGSWGFAPLIYIPMGAFGAGALEIMAHRAVWSILFTGALVLMTRQSAELLSYITQPKMMLILLVSSLMIAINWGVFVWAVTNHRTIEASLGYYLNPLLNMAAGALLFKERLDRFGKMAIGLAIIGVSVQALALGHVPYVSLILAFSFATYGIIRKQLAINALSGLFIECLFLVVPGIVYLIWLQSTGEGHFFVSPQNAFWFFLTGPVTVLPLFLFSYVAQRLPLSTMGFIQFLAPSIAFGIGLWQGELFTPLRALSFAFIWGGAFIFAYGAWRRFNALKI